MTTASKTCLPEVCTVTIASHYQVLSLLFPAICSALLVGIRLMESFSRDTEGSTEDIPGEIVHHVVIRKRIMVKRKQVFDLKK